ncbi:MAG: putative hydroxymethylpyrimidine transporter CytX [Chloroflexi bacterium]|nr:putative hydroxymethylpyrimidine transporter CytX [Chloroflexota bacterium]
MSSVFRSAGDVGINPVPPERRALGTWDSFVLWADLGISFLVMVVGMFLVPGLGLGQALLAIVVGAVIGNLLLGIAATIGSDTGVPTMVLLRGPLGRRGSYLPTALNVLQLIGWATLEVIVMAQAADMLAMRIFGTGSAYHLWVVAFAVLTAAMAISGPIVVTKQWLEKFAVWAVLITTVWITLALLMSHDLGALLAKPGTGEMSFWLAVDLVVALPISWFPLVADYSRFSRSRGAAFWGTSLGYFVPQVWFYALGATLVLTLGIEGDPNAPIAPLLGAISGLTVGWLALFVLLVDETDEAFANVYSTAVSIQNLLPQLSQRALVLGISAIVLVLALLVPLVQYESFLLLIGSAFVPLLGVLAADYFALHGHRYSAAALLAPAGVPQGAAGVRWPGTVTWLVGVASYLAIAGVPAFGIAGVAPWLGASLPSFTIAFVLHATLGWLTGRSAQAALALARS